MGPRVVRGFVLGLGLVSLGLLWAFLGHGPSVDLVVSSVLRDLAWPEREEPYVLLFYDPLCPVCRRLERDMEEDAVVRRYVRYVPAFMHQGSYEAWLRLLVERGWDEGEARVWLEQMAREVEGSGLSTTPTAYVVNARGEAKTIVGYPGYRRWREEVLDGLGVGP